MNPAILNTWRERPRCGELKWVTGGVRTILGSFACELQRGHLGLHTSDNFRAVAGQKGWA